MYHRPTHSIFHQKDHSSPTAITNHINIWNTELKWILEFPCMFKAWSFMWIIPHHTIRQIKLWEAVLDLLYLLLEKKTRTKRKLPQCKSSRISKSSTSNSDVKNDRQAKYCLDCQYYSTGSKLVVGSYQSTQALIPSCIYIYCLQFIWSINKLYTGYIIILVIWSTNKQCCYC